MLSPYNIYQNYLVAFLSFSRNDMSGTYGSSEMSTAENGSLQQIIQPVIQNIRPYFPEALHGPHRKLINNYSDDLYMLPVYLLQFVFEYKSSHTYENFVLYIQHAAQNDDFKKMDFSIERNSQVFEELLNQICQLNIKEIITDNQPKKNEILRTMYAIFSLNCIEDECHQ